MFLIMGISQKKKKLNFDQLVICKCCGKYGHLEIFLTYSYFMLFFLPIVKWNKRYYVKMSCCSAVDEINTELGRAVEKGEITALNLDAFDCGTKEQSRSYCSDCGFSTTKDYQFCPKCGKEM